MSTDAERMELSIAGRVQGVGFRHFTVQTAGRLDHVTGWVRNEPDGSVTVVAEGPRQELDSLLEELREGPRMARVESVEQDWKESTGEFSEFRVRYNS